jgi:alanine racemase
VSDPSTSLRSRAWVEVRLDRLRENARAVQRALRPGTALVPMVKADAYGLGMAAVVRALETLPDGSAPWAFGVATVAEGEALRDAGWAGRVLVFAPAAPGEFARAARADLALCLSDLTGVRRWAAAAATAGRVLPFHLEVDTGMGRAGFLWSDVDRWGPEVGAAVGNLLRCEGCFTHFHSADEPDLGPTDEQWRRFRQTLAALPAWAGAARTHVANSAASVRRGGYHCDLVRPGIFLYGGGVGAEAEPAPVVAVRARLVLVRDVPEGASLGYGATYRARRPERWGTLAIGYGDGIPRALAAGGGSVLIRGRRVPLIGRVSMDMATVDLTDVPSAAAGDVATLIGHDGDERIGLDEVAARCGTISYEILTGLRPRLPRLYLENGDGATAVATAR